MSVVELSFKNALFAAGLALMAIGIGFGVANMGGASGSSDLVEAISFGFASLFISFFSGSLIGVGMALVLNGFIVGIRGAKVHVLAALGFALLSLLVSASSVASPASVSFPLFVLFFSGLSATGAFLISAVLFALPHILRGYLREHYGMEK